MYEYLVPSWFELFGKDLEVRSHWRRCVLRGRLWGFKRLRAFPMCSLLPVCGLVCESSAAATAACHKPSPLIMDSSPPGLQTQLNPFFRKFTAHGVSSQQWKVTNMADIQDKRQGEQDQQNLRPFQFSGLSFICHYMAHKGNGGDVYWTWN